MKGFFAIIFFISNAIALPKVPIQDPDILKVLKQFNHYVQKEGFDKSLTGKKQQFCLRIELQNDKKVIYVTCANSIGFFVKEGCTPDNFSEYAGRLVFMYSGKTILKDDEILFENFYDQFSSTLFKNYTRDGQYIEKSILAAEVMEIPVWRVVFSGGKRIDYKHVRFFPTRGFYEKYRYDENGYLMGMDGIYEDGDQIMPRQREPENFDMRKYILASTSVPYDSLKPSTVDANIVFSESGCVEDSEITGMSDFRLIKEIKEALKKMPCWAPGTVGGKAVKVRTRYRL